MRTPRSPYSRWSALIRPSHARTYGQWLHDWTRTSTEASAYSSSEWLRPSTPGRSKVGAVSITLIEEPPRVAHDSGRVKRVRRRNGRRGRSVRAAPPHRPDRRRVRRYGSSARRSGAPRARPRGAPSPRDATGIPPRRGTRSSRPAGRHGDGELELDRPCARPYRLRLAGMQQSRLHDQLRPREVVQLRGHGADALPERVAGCVSSHGAVRVERVERRHAEQLEVVERLEVGAVDHGRPLRLEPQRDSGAGESRTVVGDEGYVGPSPDAYEPWHRAGGSNPLRDRVEDRLVAQIVDRAPDPVREGRADCDDDFGRVDALRGLVSLEDEGLPCDSASH